MSLGRLKCKDNNAAYVKRMMPEPSGVTYASTGYYMPKFT